MTTPFLTPCRLSPLSSLARLAGLIKGTSPLNRQTGGGAEPGSQKIHRMAHDYEIRRSSFPTDSLDSILMSSLTGLVFLCRLWVVLPRCIGVNPAKDDKGDRRQGVRNGVVLIPP